MALTEAEKKLLEELEKTLTQEDPKLVSKFSQPPARLHPARAVGGVIGFIVGLLTLVIGMSNAWWVSVIGFVVMLVSAVAVISAWTGQLGQPGHSAAPGGAKPAAPSAKPVGEDFIARLEKRWQDRQEQ